MARYKNGINGPVSGKVGTVVGVTWRGIDYFRSLPKPNKKAPSERQLNQRFVFAMINSWLRPLRDLIWIGYQVFKGNKTPMNAAVSLLLNEAVTGNSADDYAIDFSKVVLSRGELLVSMLTEVTISDTCVLVVKWTNFPLSVFNSAGDLVTVVVYNQTKQKFVTFQDIVSRETSVVNLTLPADFGGDRVHGWMHYVNVGRDAVSTSVYLGSLV